jgi:hypothetical protein
MNSDNWGLKVKQKNKTPLPGEEGRSFIMKYFLFPSG